MLDTSVIAALPVPSAPQSRLARIIGGVAADFEQVRVSPCATEMSALIEASRNVFRDLNVLDAAEINELLTSACQVWLERQVGRQGVSSSRLSESSIIRGWSNKPSWREQLEAEISAYTLRGPGWDGYSAKAIDHAAIVDAVTFVRRLPDDLPPPLDQPCSDGEVSLVWRRGEHFAEIGFVGDGTFWWYCTDGEQEDGGEELPVGHGIPAELNRIMGFPVEESAPSKAPWGETLFPEWTPERRVEASFALSACVHPMAEARLHAEA